MLFIQVFSFSNVPAFADDQVGVKVDVLNAAGAPTPTITVNIPVGVKSDAAKVKIKIEGLEASRPVFFSVTPMTQAFSRSTTDASGNLTVTVELPYGIEPGSHTLMARSVFSSDGISVMYTVGTFYVNNAGVLANSDGSNPKGVKQAPEVAPNAPDAFGKSPEFTNSNGSIRISEPQVRVTQSWLPSAQIGLSFQNAANQPVSFEAKITLEGPFGVAIGQSYYAKILGLGTGETRTLLLTYENLPPVGFYTLHTELILPADFKLDTAVETSHDSGLTIFPRTVFVLISAIVLAIFGSVVRRKRKSALPVIAA